MSMELKDEMKGCVSENVMFLQWGELCEGERSYRAVLIIHRTTYSNLKTSFNQFFFYIFSPVFHFPFIHYVALGCRAKVTLLDYSTGDLLQYEESLA